MPSETITIEERLASVAGRLDGETKTLMVDLINALTNQTNRVNAQVYKACLNVATMSATENAIASKQNDLLQSYGHRGISERIDQEIFMETFAVRNIDGVSSFKKKAISFESLQTKADVKSLFGHYFRLTLDKGCDMYSMKKDSDSDKIIVNLWSNKLGGSDIVACKTTAVSRRAQNIYDGLKRSKEKILSAMERCGYPRSRVIVIYNLLTGGGLTSKAEAFLTDRNVYIYQGSWVWDNALPDSLKQWMRNHKSVLLQKTHMQWLYQYID